MRTYVRIEYIRATLMLLSLRFPLPSLLLLSRSPRPIFPPLSESPLSLSLFLLIVTFTPVDHCARYYACIIGFRR